MRKCFGPKAHYPLVLKRQAWGGAASKPTFGMGFVERSSSARASLVPTEVEGGMESELMAVQVKAAIELTPR